MRVVQTRVFPYPSCALISVHRSLGSWSSEAAGWTESCNLGVCGMHRTFGRWLGLAHEARWLQGDSWRVYFSGNMVWVQEGRDIEEVSAREHGGQRG